MSGTLQITEPSDLNEKQMPQFTIWHISANKINEKCLKSVRKGMEIADSQQCSLSILKPKWAVLNAHFHFQGPKLPKLAVGANTARIHGRKARTPIYCHYLHSGQASTKWYGLVTEARVWTTCPGLLPGSIPTKNQTSKLLITSLTRYH